MSLPSMDDRPRLLLTGFEPFAHHLVNPSWIAARRMSEEFSADVVARCLPVHHLRARQSILRIIADLHPQAILLMGLAAGDWFRIERSARKIDEFQSLIGASECRCSMNDTLLADALTRANAPWRFSDDAGRYVCESTYWSVLDHLQDNAPSIPCAFLHVPAESEAWPAERTCDVVREVVKQLLES